MTHDNARRNEHSEAHLRAGMPDFFCARGL